MANPPPTTPAANAPLSSVTSHPSRRRLFTGAALLPIVAVASNAAATPRHPDAALLSLGAALDTARVALDQAIEVQSDDENCDELPEWETVSGLVAQIERLPFKTAEGAVVKAKALHWCRDGEPVNWQTIFWSESEDSSATDQRLIVSLVAGLCDLAYPGDAA